MKTTDIIRLSEILGQMGTIKRATKLPGGEYESDAHHSFSLALIAYEINKTFDLQLDSERLLLYALVHDLLEIITGDEVTLHYTEQNMQVKRHRELAALGMFETLFSSYPDLKSTHAEYERLDTPEAATIFILDKACPAWTHHHDNGATAIELNLHSRADVQAWAARQKKKFAERLQVDPPAKVFEIFEASAIKLEELYKE